MIIECPACRTRFRLDEAKIKGRGARVRCRRCGEPIVVLKPEEPQTEAAKEAGGSLLDLRSVVRESMGEKPEEAPAVFTPPAEISAGKDETVALPDEAPAGKEYPYAGAEALPPASEEEAVPPLPDLAVEFRPEEKIDIDLPAEPPKEERASDFLMGGGETLDYLKEESVKAEKAEMFDISTSLRKEPIELLSTAEVEETPPSGAAYEQAGEARQAAPFAAPAESPPAGEIAPTVLTEPQDAGEALRPKPTAQRKAASPLLRPSLLALVLLFVALAGGGAYLGFTKSGQDLLRGLVPGMESLWLRNAGKPGPQFDVRNLIGYYETNTKAGNLFIIKGQVANMG
ncbi:MAG TPA: zinc-ribbon domain-containing protein, partial [Candidatus Deferrimicrobiaceae bacterium]